MFAASQYMDSCAISVRDGDTLYMAWLHEVWVYPPMKFKNKRQEKFYWRTVRDVKKCLPYAKMISKDMEYADQELAKLPDKKSRKKWWRAFEKQLYKKYEKDFANFWQFVAKLFKNDLKEEYDASDKDRIVERVINLVEAGQL